jgi:hypothetical protein
MLAGRGCRVFSSLFLAVSLAACSGPIVEALPGAALNFTPPDGTTAWQASPLLSFQDGAGIIDAATLADLAGRVALQTWPEGIAQPIATDTPMGPSPTEKVVRVTPQNPLEDRWYVVEMSSLPSNVSFYSPLTDGTVGARFRPDSFPRVAHIQFCGKAPPGMKLVVIFSESVALASPADETVSLQIAGTPSTCASYDTAPDTLYFACDDLKDTDSVTVAVGPGVAATTGAGIPLAPQSWTIAISELPAGSCRDFAPAF